MHLLYMFQDTYWVHSLGLQLLHSYQDKQQSRNFQVSQINMKRKPRPHTTIIVWFFFCYSDQSLLGDIYGYYCYLLKDRVSSQASSLVGKLWVTSLKKSRVELFLLYLLISVSISLRCYVSLFSPASCHCEFLFYPRFIFILTAHYSALSLLFPVSGMHSLMFSFLHIKQWKHWGSRADDDTCHLSLWLAAWESAPLEKTETLTLLYQYVGSIA